MAANSWNLVLRYIEAVHCRPLFLTVGLTFAISCACQTMEWVSPSALRLTTALLRLGPSAGSHGASLRLALLLRIVSNSENMIAQSVLAVPLQLQARVEGKLGYIDAARSLYAEASQAPDCSGSAVVAAWAEFEYEHGNLEEYHRLLLRVFELEPSSPAALQRLGTGLRRCRRFEEAREAFKAALEIDPTHAQSYQVIGHAMQQFHDALQPYSPACVRTCTHKHLAPHKYPASQP